MMNTMFGCRLRCASTEAALAAKKLRLVSSIFPVPVVVSLGLSFLLVS
jgi:hypothetical protein